MEFIYVFKDVQNYWEINIRKPWIADVRVQRYVTFKQTLIRDRYFLILVFIDLFINQFQSRFATKKRIIIIIIFSSNSNLKHVKNIDERNETIGNN